MLHNQSTPLVPKRFYSPLDTSSPPLSREKEAQHAVFLGLLKICDESRLKLLLTRPTSMELSIDLISAITTTNLSDTEKFFAAGKHANFFPTRYEMDHDIKRVAIRYCNNHATNRQIPEEQKWKLFQLLIKHGAKAQWLVLQPYLSLDRLKQILSWGVDVNTHHLGVSILYIAGVDSSMGKTLYLLQHPKIDVNQRAADGAMDTPLHHLLANEHFEHATQYISSAKNKIYINLKDGEGKTPLLLAAKLRSFQMVSHILAEFQGRVDVDATDLEGRTALHYACAYGDVLMASALLTANANSEARDSKNRTPSNYAAFSKQAVEELLLSIEIHPDRDIKADRNALPWRLGDNEILASKENLEKYASPLMFCFNQDSNATSRAKNITLLEHYLATFSGKRVGQVCMEGHEAVACLLLTHRYDEPRSGILPTQPSSPVSFAQLSYTMISGFFKAMPNNNKKVKIFDMEEHAHGRQHKHLI